MEPSRSQRTTGIAVAIIALLAFILVCLHATANAAMPSPQPERAAPAPMTAIAQEPEDAPTQAGTAAGPAPTRGTQRRVPPRSRDVGIQSLASTTSDVSIAKSASTATGDGLVVYNGARITYTLAVANNTVSAIDVITLYDTLPDALDGATVICAEPCGKVIERQLIPTPLGGFTVVSVTTELTWSIKNLGPNSVQERTFSARVVGQTDGAVVRNVSDLEYSGGIAISNEAATTVRVQVEDQGRATLAEVPTWVSSDMGGTMSLDWGDFDRDGFLDLALGSTVGTSVYRNEAGQLTPCWSNSKYTLGVRWADFDADGQLELVAVGNSSDKSAVSPGSNYVYDLDPTCSEVTSSTFTSDYQLLRVEAGYFDADDNIDLIASTNAISVAVPLRLYSERDAQGRFTGNYVAVSSEASAAIAQADYDNDDHPDLVLGVFPNVTRLLNGLDTVPVPVSASALDVDVSTAFLPYDFAWGDFDRDGLMDLAAAFPLEKKARVYRNLGGSFERVIDFQTALFRTPEAVEWGDFNGDGFLDLAVGDMPPKIYWNHSGTLSKQDPLVVPLDPGAGDIWAMAAADHDNDGDVDLALGNWKGASLLFSDFAPLLPDTLTSLDSGPASGVAWADLDGNGYQDLILGSGGRTEFARVYLNDRGAFSPGAYLNTKYGPHSLAVADVDRDGYLDVALGSIWLGDRIYLGRDRPTTGEWKPAYTLPTSSYALAWGDVEGDGDLDLLAGMDGPNALFVNDGIALGTTPLWSSAEADDTRSVAWLDYDKDGFPDFVAGNYGQPNRLYHNNGDRTFSLVPWETVADDTTRSLAWGDFNGDGWPDLAVGNYGQANLIYENLAGILSNTPIVLDGAHKTTSLAWGDWDNDGDLDLAIGNDGESDQVLTNQGSRPGLPRLLWLWTSGGSLRTAGVAWGDRDGDGDLDLAIGQTGTTGNGYYENSYVLAAHVGSSQVLAMPLPNNPSYVSISRPGITKDAFFYSSPELLAYPSPPTSPYTVTIDYTLFDPDGSRTPAPDAAGDPLSTIMYQYSLDGGGTWQTAGTPVTASTSLQGQPGTFVWNAREVATLTGVPAISDNARFRLTTIHQTPVGPVQRASTSSQSPPFRVRATTCVWPMGPSISVSPEPAEPDQELVFEGKVLKGDGPLTFLWDFGDGSSGQGQVVRHTYARGGIYEVRLTVNSRPCPVVGTAKASKTLDLGTEILIYLPLVTRSGQASAAAVDNAITPATGLPQPEDAAPAQELWQSDGPNSAYVSRPPAVEPDPGQVQMAALFGGQPMPSSASPASSASPFPGSVATSMLHAANVDGIVEEGGIHGQPSISGDGSRITFWSTADLEPLPCFQQPLSGMGKLLLVDDDDNAPDVRSYYEAALNQLGVPYDVYDTQNSTTEPSLPTLLPYRGVIWFSGVSYGGTYYPKAGPLPETENALAAYLASGRFLFISSQDYLYDRLLTPFMQSYLGVASYAHDVQQTTVAGSGSVFQSLGIRSLSYPFTNYSDRISPDSTAELAFEGNWGDAAVDKGTPVYRTTFWGFPFEALPADVRSEAMSTALYWLGYGCKYVSSNGDGNIEVFAADLSNLSAPSLKHVTASRGSILGGFNLWPSISADGSRIAFFSDRNLDPAGASNADENFEIFAGQMGASGPITVTQVTHTNQGSNLWPSISADGSRIAFASDRDLDPGKLNGDGNQEIYVAELTPAGTVSFAQLTDSPAAIVNDQPAITGDGNAVAYTRFDQAGNAQLWLHDGSGERLLAGQGTNLQPAIDGTGRRIAFTSDMDLDPSLGNGDGNQEIFVVEVGAASTLTFTQITSTTWPTTNDQPALSEDGQRLAFVSGSSIWLYDDYGAPKAILLSAEGDGTSRPTISADGIWIAYTANQKIYRAFSPLTDLSVTKTGSPDTAVPGQSLAYTVAVANPGVFDVVGAGISDTIPISIENPVWQCTALNAWPCSTPLPGDRVLSQTVVISANGAITYTVTGTVVPSATGTLSNLAQVIPPLYVTDQDPANNTALLTTTLIPEADLRLEKRADPDPVAAGATLTYTLLYTNAGGPSYSWDVVISETLPAGVLFGDMVRGLDPPLQDGATLAWAADSLAVGETGELVFTATVLPWFSDDTITNTAIITSSTRDPVPGNNRQMPASSVIISADLSLAKSAAVTAVEPGNALTYTLDYANAGPSDAREVYITDTLPISVTWDGTILAMDPLWAGPVQGANPRTWVWYTPALSTGVSGTITFAVVVSDSLPTPETISNEAIIAHSGLDGDPGNSQDAASTLVISPSLRLEKTVYTGHNNGNGCDRAGDSVVEPKKSAVTYCFLVANTGDTYLDGITIEDPDLAITEADMTLIGGSSTPLPTGDSLTYYYETEVVDALINTAVAEGNPTNAGGIDLPGVTSPTDSDSASIVLPPTPPADLVATAVSESQIDLSWTDNSDDEDGFRIERALSDTGPWTEIHDTVTDTTSYSDTGLSCSTTYYYRVAAFRTSDSSLSSYTNVASAATFPCAPSGLSATTVSETEIQLAWVDESSDESGFEIERSPDGADWTYLTTTAAGATSYSDSTVDCSSLYYYRVRAIRADGAVSDYSADSSASTWLCAPTNLSVAPASETQIDLAWSDNSADEEGFYIERSADGTTGWTEVHATAADETQWSDAPLTCATDYYYRVAAFRDAGASVSAYTDVVSGTTAPCGPTGLGAVAVSETQIDLAWTDNATDETAFRIERWAAGLVTSDVITLTANTTQTTDSSVACSTLYSYTVAAFRAGDDVYSSPSNLASARTYPCAPTGLTATLTSTNQVDLEWVDNSSDETEFRIERSTNGSDWVQILTAGANVTQTNDLTAMCSTYYYRILAYRDADAASSGYSQVVSVTMPTVCAPTGLNATAASETQIDLAWADNASDETAYRIERLEQGLAVTQVITLSADITGTSDSGLACGTHYTYTVAAYRASDGIYSTPSNASTAWTYPCAPSALTATFSPTNRIDLQWTDNSDDESEFRIQRSTNGVDWTEILTTTAGVTSTSDVSVLCSTYQYRLRAYRETDDTFSGFSNVASATLPTVCAPTGLAAAPASQTQLDLTWIDNANDETAFRIERWTEGSAVTDVITVTADLTVTSDTGLACGTTYSYTIAAYRAGDNLYSAFSPVVTAVTDACASPVRAPTAGQGLAFRGPSMPASRRASAAAPPAPLIARYGPEHFLACLPARTWRSPPGPGLAIGPSSL